jgi:hypothetical protein
MSERTGDTTFQEYNLVNNNGYGGQSYNIDADAAQSLGPVSVTPSGLADLDNRMNADWWAKQGQQQGTAQPNATSHEQPVGNQSIGERASDPTYKFYDYDSSQKESFDYRGHSYHTTSDGRMFLSPQGELNEPVEIDPNKAAAIRGELAQREANQRHIENLDYTQDGSLGIAASGSSKDLEEFGKGFAAIPDGDNPYQGHSTAYQVGRFVGKYTPGWDDGRQAAITAYDIGKRYYNGQPVGAHDWFKLGEHSGKAALEVGGLGGALKARKVFKK